MIPILVITVELIYIYFIRNRLVLLTSLAIVNMIFISFFAPTAINFFGLVTNKGNSLYSAIFIIQTLILTRFGNKEAHNSINNVFFSVIIGVILFISLTQDFTSRHILISGVSLLAFVLAQNIYLTLANNWKEKSYFVKVGLATIIAQYVDSMIFFPILFLNNATGILVGSLIIKTCIALISVPYIKYINKIN